MTEHTRAAFTPSPRDFRLMVLGQIISILGSALLRFALSLHVMDVTRSEAAFAALLAVSSIPMLLSPLGGALADRFHRRNLMVIFDFSSSAIVGCLFLAMAGGRASTTLIGAAMVLLSVISALYTPAVTASIPTLVAGEKLEGANGIVQAVQALSAVAAPAMGGVLYGIGGVKPLIVLSCAAFFLSAVMEIFIRIPFVRREQKGHIVPVIIKDLGDGFRYVAKIPFILKSMVLAALINLLLTPYFIVGSPIILRMTMNSSDDLFGVGMGLINAATILGALTIGFFSKKMRIRTLHRWLLLIALLALPMALSVTPRMLGLGYYPSFLLFLACSIPIAVIMTFLSIYIVTKVQKKTPNESLGKVMAIIMAAAQCAAPLGQLLYGLIFEALDRGAHLPTLFVAAAMALLALFARRLMGNEEEPA